MPPPVITPDGRYLVVRGVLWRRANPALPEKRRRQLVTDLMDARRQVKAALRTADNVLERDARSRVDAAKRALGERGEVWWTDGAPDYTRHRIENTPYADWWAGRTAE